MALRIVGIIGKKNVQAFLLMMLQSFLSRLTGIELEFDSDEEYGYFVIEKSFFVDSKKFRMVFCVERSKPTTSGVITLFQIKGK